MTRYFREFSFLGIWIAFVMLAAAAVIIFPVFNYLPPKVRALGFLSKSGIGAVVGGLVFLIFMFPAMEIPGTWAGAISAGAVVGLFAPPIDKKDRGVRFRN